MKRIILFISIFMSIIAISVMLYNIVWNKKNDISPSVGEKTYEEDSKKYDFINREKAVLDLDGDGEPELVVSYTKDVFFYNGKRVFENDKEFDARIVVYNSKVEEIARTPEIFNPPPASSLPNHMQAYKLDKDSEKEYLRLSVIAGTHHYKDMFLGPRDKWFLPVCKMEIPDTLEGCIFYTTRVDELFMKDLDEDGITDIAELVDEYPEGGGRGRSVVNGIYNFNGKFFQPLTGESYDKLFALLQKEFPDLVKQSDTDEASRKNQQFIKDAWEGKYTEND